MLGKMFSDENMPSQMNPKDQPTKTRSQFSVLPFFILAFGQYIVLGIMFSDENQDLQHASEGSANKNTKPVFSTTVFRFTIRAMHRIGQYVFRRKPGPPKCTRRVSQQITKPAFSITSFMFSIRSVHRIGQYVFTRIPNPPK